MMSDSPRGGFAGADPYPLIEKAKPNGLGPYYHHRDVLKKSPGLETGSIDDSLPWNVDPEDFDKIAVEDARIS